MDPSTSPHTPLKDLGSPSKVPFFKRPAPKDYLNACARALQQPREALFGAPPISVVLFRVQNNWFGIQAAFFAEIQNGSQIHRVPYRSNAIFKGLVNVRGELILCFSLAELLKIPTAMSTEFSSVQRRRIAIIRTPEHKIGVPVDQMQGVFGIPEHLIEAAPAEVQSRSQGIIRQITLIKGFSVELLHPESLLSCCQAAIDKSSPTPHALTGLASCE